MWLVIILALVIIRLDLVFFLLPVSIHGIWQI